LLVRYVTKLKKEFINYN